MRIKKQYNKLFFSILTTFYLSIILVSGFAQVFDNTQNPFTVKWKQINTAGFKIIYPTTVEKDAQRMANTLPLIYPFVGAGINRQNTNIPIVLQNQGTIANGFVQLAPKKSEFYTTPPQNFDSQDWLNNLAVHELRHVAQFDKLTGGKAKPFPELIYFAWMGAVMPTWFFEGDAVVTETALTNAGRGRQPNWIMPYRASILEGRNFSYSKAYFGSNKDVTPGYYQMGYLMAAAMRNNHGKFITDSLFSDIRKRPVRLYPFAQSLKKITTKNTKQYFLANQTAIKQSWAAQKEKTAHQEYASLNKASKYATNYYLPVRINNKQILALKESKTEARHFVLIDEDKTEHKLFGVAYQEQPWFSYANSILVWDEIRFDPRYKQRSYSTICSYNFKTKTFKKLSSKSRLFSPSLSANAQKIIAVQVNLSNQFNLVELAANNGEILKTYPNLENYALQFPSFSSSADSITYITVNEQGKSLWLITANGKPQQLITNTSQQINRPVFIGANIAFNAHYNGIDNIYSYNPKQGTISALSAAKYGAFNPSVANNGKITFNNYKLNGYEIAETAIEEQEIGVNNFVNFSVAAQKQENVGNVFEKITDSVFSTKKYKPLANLFNIHSLIPLAETEYVYGLQLQANDLLNTFAATADVKYHNDLRRLEYGTAFSYKALYPIFSAAYKNRPRRTFYNSNLDKQEGNWRENYIKLNAAIPISINALNHNYAFSFNLGTSYTQRYSTENMPKSFIKTLNFPMEYNFSFNHTVRTTARDIAPKWAQVFRFTYNHQPFDTNLKGKILALESFLYFPGLAKNHSLLASFNYQQATGVNRFATEIATVYGYNNILAKSKLNNTLLFNYRFPFAFPDLEIGPIAYLKSLRGGLFCHYENIGNETNFTQPKTYGIELQSTLNLLRYQPIVTAGTRLVFINQVYNQKPILEFSINYNF